MPIAEEGVARAYREAWEAWQKDHPVPTGDHSMKVQASAGRPQAEVEREIIATMADWMRMHAELS